VTSDARRIARVLAFGFGLHFKMMSRSPFELWVVLASPIIFATMAHFLFVEHAKGMLVAALASGVMGIWSGTVTMGSGALQRQRRLGILELMVASPVPFWSILLPITVAISGIGIYSMATGLLYVRLLFGVPIVIRDWWAFVAAVPATIVAIGALGFLFSAVLVRFRSAWMLGNLFEWPVWMISGLLIPVAVLPGWLHPISWVFAPTWGMAALRAATLGAGHPWRDIGFVSMVAGAYFVAGAAALQMFLYSARATATLGLTS
jgi:ABC-2 type transport system permease protein